MSTLKDHGKIVFECNECGETFETEETDFYDALETLRNDPEGCQWTSVKDEGTDSWNNYCGMCSSNV